MKLAAIQEVLSRKPKGNLYHYTSQVGLLGIIQKKEIWATHVHYLNDSTEFLLAKTLAHHVASEMLKTAEHQDEIAILKEIVPGIQSAGINVCVCSFSEWPDQLSQWRAYGRNGGCSIGFKHEFLKSIADREDWLVAPCIYDPDEQQDLMIKIIREVIEEALANPSKGQEEEGEEGEEWAEGEPGRKIAYLLNRVAPIFKENAFSEEKEWRFISRPLMNTHPRFNFRPGLSMLIPYFALHLADEKNVFQVEEVVVAPSANSDLAEQAVRQLLVSKRLRKAKVRVSCIPYRDW